MNASFRTLVILFFVAGLFNSCTIIGETIKPSKNYITRNYQVKEFNQIDANTVGNIYYTQSTDGSTSVEIYGPDNIIALMQVSVKNGMLQINMEKSNRVRNVKNLKITICSPSLEGLYMKGVGDVIIENGLKTDNLTIESKGVGNINLKKLDCGKISVQLIGVGNVELSGNTQNANLDLTGVGDINAENLKGTHVEAYSKGVGGIKCYAVQSLTASVKGVGSIYYKGNPSEKNFSKGGVGSIKNI